MSNQLQISGAAKIRSIQGPVVANSGVITALDGDASQYVRGDGTLADFPTSTGGGSSVSYYLNTSVSQGTIGGVAYKQLSKVPISGAGTDVTISANGYIASYLTDANDPALLEVPAGNFNCEFYFSVNSNAHNPYVYAELYKYDGTTFTLLGSNQAIPEYLTNGTTLSAYYFAIPVATSVLTITDRIAIRIYVNVDGRTVTLHTENNHLCQVVTTFSKGLTTLNSLTRQVQFFQTGTSGTDFAISSSVATHTFNLPVASAANTGKLSSTDWSTFNGKVPYTGATASVDLGIYNLTASGVNSVGFTARGSGTNSGYIIIKQGTTYLGNVVGYNSINANSTKYVLISDADGTNYKSASFQLGSLTNNTERTYTLPDATGTLALTSDLGSYVPYTGATANVDLGLFSLKANGILAYGNGTAGGIVSFTQTGTLAGVATGAASIGSVSAGKLNIYFGDAGLEAAILDNSLLTADRTYNFPNASGTIALTSDLGSYLPLAGGIMTGSILLNNNLAISGQLFGTSSYASMISMSPSNKIVIDSNSQGVLFGGTIGQGAYTYNLPTASGILALTSDIPSLTGYVPYTGATGNLYLGVYGLLAAAIVIGQTSTQGYIHFKTGGPTLLSANTCQAPYGISGMIYSFDQTSSNYKQFVLDSSLLTNNTIRTYSMPDASGTLALTSDIPSGTVTGTGTTNYVSKFTASGVIGNSLIFDNGTNVGIGNTNTTYTLDVSGTGRFTSTLLVSGNTSIGTTNSSVRLNIQASANFETPTLGTATGTMGYLSANGLYGMYIGIGNSGNTWLQSQRNDATTTAYNLLLNPSGGNVGIGTSSPASLLHLQSSASGGQNLRIQTSIAAGRNYMQFANGSGDMGFFGYGAADGKFYIYNQLNDDMLFATNNTLRMSITSGGTLLVNATAVLDASARFQTNGNVYLGNQPAGAGTGTLKYHASTGLVSYDASSRIYKKDIVELEYGLDSVLKMSPKKYKWKSNDEEDLGFIADEMYQVIPEIVFLANNKINKTELKDGEPMGINYDRLVPVLVKAIQEMNTKSEEQQALIQELNERLDKAGL